jgi:large subunit ribosomal protein L3
MSVVIIGKKLGMTQVFDRFGHLVPVTVVQAGPCPVTQIKTQAKDGYSAIQIGFEQLSKRRAEKKPVKGHFKTSGVHPQKILKEVRVEDTEKFKIGDAITVREFTPNDKITVIGLSKGRGFAGVMKRHNFKGKHSGHGAHEVYRHGGSIGCRTPKRTIKGMRMPGHMGTQRVTVPNLQIILVDKEQNLILIKGAVPGWNNGYLFIRKSS